MGLLDGLLLAGLGLWLLLGLRRLHFGLGRFRLGLRLYGRLGRRNGHHFFRHGNFFFRCGRGFLLGNRSGPFFVLGREQTRGQIFIKEKSEHAQKHHIYNNQKQPQVFIAGLGGHFGFKFRHVGSIFVFVCHSVP